MNIYKTLNEITSYIDENIEEKIDYEILAKMMGVNAYTMQRIFSVLVGIPLAEYIRKRKLSCAAYDLLNSESTVMEIAIKYGYENATSFSRAFENFHGVKPSLIKNNLTSIKELSRKIFNETIQTSSDIEYTIVNLPTLNLYGIGVKTSNETIKEDAPKLFEKLKKNDILGKVYYGMTTYEDTARFKCSYYYCLCNKKIDDFEKIVIDESKYLKFVINSQNAEDIQKMVHKFYTEFLPSCKYNLKDTPELEYYHDGITEFLVPIY